MRRARGPLVLFLSIVSAISAWALTAGCAPKNGKQEIICADDKLDSGTGSSGTGVVFQLDPMTTSGNPNLSPESLTLDQYLRPIALNHLGGKGVLEGQYVDVRTGIKCNEWFGAQEKSNHFSYLHSDSRFQEVMAYYYGDNYRAGLDQLGYLAPLNPVRIVAHCEENDNAYFSRRTSDGAVIEERVCLGDSIATPGASYADDASVVIHELQHATTMDSYSLRDELGWFLYDEAGALNEAISDFMSLAHTDDLVASPFDPRTFSRWALGTFIPGFSGVRGAHRCPEYDSSFPNCSSYPSFSAASNHVSYVYPDGLGWPYAKNFNGPGYVASAFRAYTSQEEIHNAGVLMVGALWDVYDALKANHSGSADTARDLVSKVVLEAVKHLPKPSSLHYSPVSFRELANQMVSASALLSLSTSDQDAVTQALTARGLVGGTLLDSTWAAVGTGVLPNLGLKIVDDPNVLKGWATQLGANPATITQGFATGLNKKLDPGDVAAIWFDIRNQSATTAGGVEVTVTSLDGDVTLLGSSFNWGTISSSSTQIHYQKVNGTSVVSALSSTNASYHVPTGNSYFLTDPFYSANAKTAVWVKVSPTAAHGKTVTFEVKAKPTNGAASTVSFTATIN